MWLAAMGLARYLKEKEKRKMSCWEMFVENSSRHSQCTREKIQLSLDEALRADHFINSNNTVRNKRATWCRGKIDPINGIHQQVEKSAVGCLFSFLFVSFFLGASIDDFFLVPTTKPAHRRVHDNWECIDGGKLIFLLFAFSRPSLSLSLTLSFSCIYPMVAVCLCVCVCIMDFPSESHGVAGNFPLFCVQLTINNKSLRFVLEIRGKSLNASSHIAICGWISFAGFMGNLFSGFSGFSRKKKPN